jgi:hypothetical protein
MIGPDGFILHDLAEGDMVNSSRFSKSPVQFLKVLVANVRQNNRDIGKTHIGRILDGMRLLESDFNAKIEI